MPGSSRPAPPFELFAFRGPPHILFLCCALEVRQFPLILRVKRSSFCHPLQRFVTLSFFGENLGKSVEEGPPARAQLNGKSRERKGALRFSLLEISPCELVHRRS